MKHMLAVLLLAVGACGGGMSGTANQSTARLQSAQIVPAAQGTITADENKNGNLDVAVKVDHLAPASKVRQDAQTYVVWLVPTGQPAHSIGTLQLDDNLHGELATMTPLRRFEIFVTAEPSSTVTKPSGQPVLRGRIDK